MYFIGKVASSILSIIAVCSCWNICQVSQVRRYYKLLLWIAWFVHVFRVTFYILFEKTRTSTPNGCLQINDAQIEVADLITYSGNLNNDNKVSTVDIMR